MVGPQRGLDPRPSFGWPGFGADGRAGGGQTEPLESRRRLCVEMTEWFERRGFRAIAVRGWWRDGGAHNSSPRMRILAACLAFVIGACAGPGATGPATSVSPAGSAQPSRDQDGVPHSTGRTDLILREEVGGGFVPIWFFATQAPFFSLYGDGTVLYRDESAPLPEPDAPGIVRGHPFRMAKLTEEQVQDLLRLALVDGGLAAARSSYDAPNVADAPTTIFTIRAGGVDKTVSVYALGMDGSPGDLPARQAFQRLEERLRGLISGGSLGGVLWQPERWRGTLTEAGGMGGPARAWPWSGVQPTDFVAGPIGQLGSLRHRTLSSAEVEVLGLDGIEGGFHGLLLEGPDGKLYSFGLRPLLPDETE